MAAPRRADFGQPVQSNDSTSTWSPQWPCRGERFVRPQMQGLWQAEMKGISTEIAAALYTCLLICLALPGALARLP